MASPCRIIRFPEVLALTALSRAHIYRKMAQGTFPNRLKIGKRAVGWQSTDVDNWLAGPR